MQTLPDFVAPMLATLGDPFDSADHVFELKWDGFRGLVFADDSLRISSRNQQDLLARFPDLTFLEALPPGTLLDGEIVAIVDGKPDFQALGHGTPGRTLHYVAFDLLYEGGRSLMERPLIERRERLELVVAEAGVAELIFSDGVVGAGRALFEQLEQQDVEGMVAKRLDSPYLPGKRSEDWVKAKVRRMAHCLILGYVVDGRHLKSVVVAMDDGGVLRSVGRVGSGLDEARRRELQGLCNARARDEPLVEVPEADSWSEEAVWIEPGLYCTVSFSERTNTGNLRAPVFHGLIVDEE